MTDEIGENIVEPLLKEEFFSDQYLEPVPNELDDSLEQMKIDWSTIDPYNDDEHTLKFLHEKPTCFIITGKPGCGKTTLAKKLAQEWKCELINATDLINQHIEHNTPEGQMLLDILTSGKCVSDEIVTKLIIQKLHSPEVAHHGYVLDGYPSLDQSYEATTQQWKVIENLKLKPDFVLNLTIPDKDLHIRRIGQRFDPSDAMIYVKANYDPTPDPVLLRDIPLPVIPKKKEIDGEEEEEEEKMEPDEPEEEEEEIDEDGGGGENWKRGSDVDFPRLKPQSVERLLKRPEDFPAAVDSHLEAYAEKMQRLVDNYSAQHDQQKVVKIDANLKPSPIIQQLLQKLRAFPIRPAATPIRLFSGDGEEEVPEDMETDELMRMLAVKQMIAPRFRWQQSKWLKYCPVALYEGNLVVGKPEFAVAFLNKVYVLSSQDALMKFLKNPRPFLLPPQPRPPCKISVIGPPCSGKTSLCRLLAKKYQATILNMDDLIKPKKQLEMEKLLDQVRKEATEIAINTVKYRLQAEADAKKQAEINAQAQLNEDLSEDENPDGTIKEQDEEAEGAVVVGSEPATVGDNENTLSIVKETSADKEVRSNLETETVDTEGEVEVTRNHPEVIQMVEQALQDARQKEIHIAPDAYIEVLELAIQRIEKNLAHSNPQGQLHGRWILDNFPTTRDQCAALIERGLEKGLMPDEIIYLKDESENGDYLLRRWYKKHRHEVDKKIEDRLAEEAKARARREEEERERLAEEMRKRDEEEKLLKKGDDDASEADEKEKKIKGEEEGEEDDDDDDKFVDDEEEKPLVPVVSNEKTSPSINNKESENIVDAPEEAGGNQFVRFEEVSKENQQQLPVGPEMEIAKVERREYDNEWASIHGMLTGNTLLEPFELTINDRSEDFLLDTVTQHMEKPFKYNAWIMTGQDIEEEEEDNEAAKEEPEEEEEEEAKDEEEEEDPNRSKDKRLGDTNYFCPVALKEKEVLWPGNPEISVKYRQKIYYLNNEEDRDKFLENPEAYLGGRNPPKLPPKRFFILGPKGSGKTFHGKYLAKKLGIYHISFHDRLQELILAKTRRKVGPEFVEEEETPLEDVVESDEETANADTNTNAVTPKEEIHMEERPVTEDGDENKNSPDDELDDNLEVEEKIETVLSELETAIKDNLENQDPLSPDHLDNIIADFWKKEPFKDVGFILEGFPRTPEEVSYLVEKGLYPDVVIVLNSEDDSIIGRLLPSKLEKWREKRRIHNEKKAEIKLKKKKKRDRAIERRRKELLKEREEKRKERLLEKQAAKAIAAEEEEEEKEESEEEEEEEEEFNIDEMLAEEFEEEEEEEEDEETEEDAIDRMTQDINETFDNDVNTLATVLDSLDEHLIPKIQFESGKKATVIRYQMTKKLKPLTDNREGLLERCYQLKEPLAEKLIRAGYVQPSRFGQWCPVALLSGSPFQPLRDDKHPPLPVLYRNYVYYLSNAKAREQFMSNPRFYLRQPNPRPVVAIKLAVLGPPKSGKTTICKRISQELGPVHLSIGEAIRRQLKNQPYTQLSRNIYNFLCKGLTVPDELAIQALEVQLMDTACSTKGYILDGYPITKAQVNLLSERQILPYRMIELVCPKPDLMIRGTIDRVTSQKEHPGLVLHDSPQILAVRLSSYEKSIPEIRQWYKQQHRNVITMDGLNSKWLLWEQILDNIKQHTAHIQEYWENVLHSRAASISDLCITPQQFTSRLGIYGQYCPVRLQQHGELVDCSKQVDPRYNEPNIISLAYAAEYRGLYYKMESLKELKIFLKQAENLVPPNAVRELPNADALPKRLTGTDGEALRKSFPAKMALKGFCPVTFLEGKCRYEALELGDRNCLVMYMGSVYSFVDELCLDKFMRCPEKYRNLPLPFKLPPLKKPLDIRQLPIPGFLEQTVADSLHHALTAVGSYKPKYPFISASRSALLYVAYHLKAFNPKGNEYTKRKYKRKLEDFEEQCELIKYLGDHMTLKYKEASARPVGFDRKMIAFLSHKDVDYSLEHWCSPNSLCQIKPDLQ